MGSTLDLLPTFLAAAGTTTSIELDGVNLLPYLSAAENGDVPKPRFVEVSEAMGLAITQGEETLEGTVYQPLLPSVPERASAAVGLVLSILTDNSVASVLSRVTVTRTRADSPEIVALTIARLLNSSSPESKMYCSCCRGGRGERLDQRAR